MVCVFFYYYVFNYLKVNNMIGGKGIGLLGISQMLYTNFMCHFPLLLNKLV